MNQYAIIGTWRMSMKGITEGASILQNGGSAADAVERAVRAVEDEPAFTSVGYGGLPDRTGHVTTDAGWMDGTTLRCGAIFSAEGISSPVRAARLLCGRETNWQLVGHGAEAFAREAGIPTRNMLTDQAAARWREELRLRPDESARPSYRGHDTVCVIALDTKSRMIVGTSTSGLFMKDPGRVGDTPVVGSGFYCDIRRGGAAATGDGEDILRGCLSYETVRRMGEGRTAMQAAQEALCDYIVRRKELGEAAGNISLIALSPDGGFGAATTCTLFPFVTGDPVGVRCNQAMPDGSVCAVSEAELDAAP